MQCTTILLLIVLAFGAKFVFRLLFGLNDPNDKLTQPAAVPDNDEGATALKYSVIFSLLVCLAEMALRPWSVARDPLLVAMFLLPPLIGLFILRKYPYLTDPLNSKRRMDLRFLFMLPALLFCLQVNELWNPLQQSRLLMLALPAGLALLTLALLLAWGALLKSFSDLFLAALLALLFGYGTVTAVNCVIEVAPVTVLHSTLHKSTYLLLTRFYNTSLYVNVHDHSRYNGNMCVRWSVYIHAKPNAPVIIYSHEGFFNIRWATLELDNAIPPVQQEASST